MTNLLRYQLFALLLAIGSFTSPACGFASATFRTQFSKLDNIINVNLFTGVTVRPVTPEEQLQSPFNSVVFIGRWQKNRQHTIVKTSCSGFIAKVAGHGNAEFLFTAAHCVPFIRSNGRLAFKYDVGALSDAHGSSYGAYQALKQAQLCSKPVIPFQFARDLAAFRLPKPFPNVTPLTIEKPSQIPDWCKSNLEHISYMNFQTKNNQLYYDPHCQRHQAIESGFNKSVLAGTAAFNCSDTLGSSGGPVFCTDQESNTRILYSVMESETRNLPGVVDYSAKTTNFGVTPEAIWNAVSQCLHIPPKPVRPQQQGLTAMQDFAEK